MSESAANASAEAIPELVELGQRLRRAREGRGIGLAELADRLHLAPEQLTALETADRSHLHEPVFVIAQAKRIAQALGVDVGEQIEHLRHSRLMQGSAPAHPPQPSAAPPPSSSGDTVPADDDSTAAPATGRPFPARLAAAIAALALLLGVGVALAIRHWGQPRTATGNATANASAPTPPAAGSGRPGAANAGPGVLQLRGDEPSWVEVRKPDGTVLFSGTLEKEARFRLGEGLKVLAGRPDLVTVSIGGQTPRRLGNISEVEWRTFSPAP
ncbi:MAG: helix-turn-helix domain-containing protein [Cyanobium sp.]